MTYLMEASDEGRRLLAQEDANPSRPRLIEAGLRAGHRALDAGCGPGGVLRDILDIVGPEGSAVGLDPSAERLEDARRILGGAGNLDLVRAALPSTGLPDASFDFVWCQYVLQYLRDPRAAIAELVRVTRPGGKVVVAEIDAHGHHNWPLPPALEDGGARLVRALERVGFDSFVGRKIFHHFRSAGLTDIRVRIAPFYVIAGPADERVIEDWRLRFRNLAPVAISEFGSASVYDAFVEGYLALLADPDALKYALILTTEGTRA